jgi:NAD(P)H-dependent FMN reductase
MDIQGISGSLRLASFNIALLEAAAGGRLADESARELLARYLHNFPGTFP